jgi:hypothetical protein
LKRKLETEGTWKNKRKNTERKTQTGRQKNRNGTALSKKRNVTGKCRHVYVRRKILMLNLGWFPGVKSVTLITSMFPQMYGVLNVD